METSTVGIANQTRSRVHMPPSSSQYTEALKLKLYSPFSPQYAFWQTIAANLFPVPLDRSLKPPLPVSQVSLYHLNQTTFSALLSAKGLYGEGISNVADVPCVLDEVSCFDGNPS